MRINNKEIKAGNAYIIADVGSNFNGSLSLAKEYIQAGKGIGLDAIKFQTYKAATLLNPLQPNGDGWEAFDIVKKYEIPSEWHYELFEYAEKLGIEFLSTPFSLDVLDELNNMGMRAFKIASGDLTFAPLLEKVATFGKPLIVSTGMAYVDEIKSSIEILRKNGAQDIALLHCVGSYPPKYESVNLRAMETMSNIFGVPVGLSDHTPDDVTALGAIALGACIIEKHITLDKKMGTPDAFFAMTVSEFRDMISNIRNLEKALGDGEKKPADDEISGRVWGRRGIYAKRDLNIGEALSIEKIKFVRPVDEIEASDWKFYQGVKLKRSVKTDMPIKKKDLIL
jgi:sialic acid synthase SpsE